MDLFQKNLLGLFRGFFHQMKFLGLYRSFVHQTKFGLVPVQRRNFNYQKISGDRSHHFDFSYGSRQFSERIHAIEWIGAFASFIQSMRTG